MFGHHGQKAPVSAATTLLRFRSSGENMNIRVPRILLIGESAPGSSNLLKWVERYGCEFGFAKSYQEACTLLKLLDFDLVLSPMGLRGVSVFPLLDRLQGTCTTLFFSKPWRKAAGGCLRFGWVESALDCLPCVRASLFLRLSKL